MGESSHGRRWRTIEPLFEGVTRIRLSQIHRALEYILWDTCGRRIVSVAELKPQAAR